MATTMPIRTKTTIAICIHIHVGDIGSTPVLLEFAPEPTRAGRVPDYRIGMRRPLAAAALVLCTCAWMVPAGEAGAASPSQQALLGGVNIDGLGFHSQPAQADSEIERSAGTEQHGGPLAPGIGRREQENSIRRNHG